MFVNSAESEPKIVILWDLIKVCEFLVSVNYPLRENLPLHLLHC